MESKRYVKDFFRKIIDKFKFKGRMKKGATNCNWPELNKYCGCCDLSTGIYIRSLITLIISAVSLMVNGTILDYLFSVENIVYNTNLTSINEYLATSRDEAERDLATLQLIYKSLLVYYIMWIIVKAIYVTTVVFTAFAIYKKISWMLKVLLFISIPNWVLDFFISFVGTIMLSEGLKVTLIICNLSEGYNILAINSEYKRMTGKSRLVIEEPDPQNDQTYANYITQHNERYRNGYTQLHCRSCTCFENTWNINNQVRPDDVISSEPASDTVIQNTNSAVPNSPNADILNDNPPEYSLNETERPQEASVEAIEPNVNQAVRPNTIELKPKEDVSDAPVIYDEQQLNVGTSPVIEDRRILPNE